MIRSRLEGKIADRYLENLHQRAVAPYARECRDLRASVVAEAWK